MKKHPFSIAIIFILMIFLSVSTFAEEFEIGAESAILVDADTGQVLYEKNADQKLPPASITKIMTLLIAMEKVEEGVISLDDKVNISKYAESMGGSQIYLAAGTSIPFGDLLKAVTIASANDASVAVAEALAGTYDNFIDWMNERARELGMKKTHFENSTGLPVEYGEHYSTARDIAVMARELVKHSQILEWSSMWVDYLELPNRKAMLVNTNKLIKKYPGLDGLKTGHTDAAGFCLAATAQRDDMRLISVVLKADSEKEREELTARLLDYGFNAFEKKKLADKGDKVQNIEIPQGKKTVTAAELAHDLEVIVKKGEEDSLTQKIVLKENLKAPIKKGEVLGQELVYQGDKLAGKVDLLATEDIGRANFIIRLWRGFVRWIGNLFKSLLNR